MSADTVTKIDVSDAGPLLQQSVWAWHRHLRETPSLKIDKAQILRSFEGAPEGVLQTLININEGCVIWIAEAELVYADSSEKVGVKVTVRH